ncbi:hypothetical protein Golax_020646 [Gossypium laxum]|uniref:Endonuclease/exonuclease/phosphatase n=1 Tax=Gossypium laxum TaxID=34288 RepID=A0A7J9B4K9_9ROSI|nr:hypothetical protein [Gossypium laxum]
MRRNGVELVKSKAQTNIDKEESQTNLRDESRQLGHKRKERVCEEESMRDGMGRFKTWIVGGDFNDILNNSEKEGGRRKLKISMDEFCNILEEFNLTDVKLAMVGAHRLTTERVTGLSKRDTNGSKPKEKSNDPRVWFRYDIYWVKEQEVRDIITSICPMRRAICWRRWS